MSRGELLALILYALDIRIRGALNMLPGLIGME